MCKCTPEIRTPFCGKIGCDDWHEEFLAAKKPREIQLLEKIGMVKEHKFDLWSFQLSISTIVSDSMVQQMKYEDFKEYLRYQIRDARNQLLDKTDQMLVDLGSVE